MIGHVNTKTLLLAVIDSLFFLIICLVFYSNNYWPFQWMFKNIYIFFMKVAYCSFSSFYKLQKPIKCFFRLRSALIACFYWKFVFGSSLMSSLLCVFCRLDSEMPDGVETRNSTLLFLRPLHRNDSGVYRCEVANDINLRSRDVRILIQGEQSL